MMKVKLSGFAELDRALGELPKSSAKSTMLAALRKAGQPIADSASANAPRDTGELSKSVVVSSRLANNIGKKEFADVMRGGGTKKDAASALRSARRGTAGESTAVVFIGPTKATSKSAAIKRIVQEFGSVKQPGTPYMRPAWDSQKGVALSLIKRELAESIIKTARRLGKGKRYSTDVKYRASLAALIANEAL